MGNRIRTEPSDDFKAPSAGRTKGSPEFSLENAGGRTRPSEDFARDGGGMPTERFMPIGSQLQRPDPLTWAREELAEAERNEFTAVCQVSAVVLGSKDRIIDFQKEGPLLGLNPKKELLIATPFSPLPAGPVGRAGRGKPIWNVEKLDERARSRVLNGAH